MAKARERMVGGTLGASNARLRSWDLSWWRWWASHEGPKDASDMFTAVFDRGQVTVGGVGRGTRLKARGTN